MATCPGCGHELDDDSSFCGYCGALISWKADAVQLSVTGTPKDVESVAARLAAELGADPFGPVRGTEDDEQDAGDVQGAQRAARRKVWAFTVGLATVIGAIAAVLALVVH